MASPHPVKHPFNLRASFPSSDEQKGFFTALSRNDTSALTNFLKKQPDIRKFNKDGDSATVVAIRRDVKPATLEFLIQNGANVNDRDKNGWTALMNAAFFDQPDKLEVLLGYGADINQQNQYGQTALHFAADCGNLACADILVICGADLSLKSFGKTALEVAQEKGNSLMVQVIEDAKARLEAAEAGLDMPEQGPLSTEKAIKTLPPPKFKKPNKAPGRFDL